MATTYSIHPAIGLARVGDSPTEFYIAPETPAGLPIDCDPKTGKTRVENGTEATTSAFKDKECRIKRQAARFKIFVQDEKSPEGRLLAPGDMIQGIGSHGKLIDIEWTVYLANKKAVWYQFQQLDGEHGYGPDHPLRNADVTDAQARQQLIIDPGPQTVYNSGKPGKPRRAEFSRTGNPGYAQTFPPPLTPHSIDTLGEILADGDLNLLVLGGHGNSGSYLQGIGHPRVENYANNPGWFDDVSDGPVMAKLLYYDEEDQEVRYMAVEEPAWVIVGQPNYVPELLNLITLDDVLYDVSVRHFAYDPYLYGTGPFDKKTQVPPEDLPGWRRAEKRYNPDYHPLFFKEIWPLLQRPFSMQWVSTLIGQSFEPHDTGPGGNFNLCQISIPPYHGQPEGERQLEAEMRHYLYECLRQPAEANQFLYRKNPDNRLYGAPLMPLLCGDNPIDNTLPSKFLHLTETQLFLLKQWAGGKFINECKEGWIECTKDPAGGCLVAPRSYYDHSARTAAELDRYVLANALGGSFCPGGEVGWIIRNPAIYSAAYRINASRTYIPGLETSEVTTTPGVELYERPALSRKNPISAGLEPGDVTKYNALPWQGDFNECSTQTIDVSYDEWNVTCPENPDAQVTHDTLWWPAHRPLQVQVERPLAKAGDFVHVQWTRGIPQRGEGNLKMVTAWKDLGFVINLGTEDNPKFAEVQRNDAALGGGPTVQGCTPAKS